MIDATISFLVGNQPWCAVALDLWLKSAVLCLAALAVSWLCGRRRVLARSAALYACLVGLTLLPAAALVFPQGRFDAWQREAQAERGGQSAERPAEQSAAVKLMATEREAEVRQLPPLDREAGPIEIAATPKTASIDWRILALVAYAVVVVGAIVRLLLSLAAVARLQSAGTALTEAVWRERLAHWRQRLGVRRPVRMLQSNQIDVPVVIGWRRPAILAPARLVNADVSTIDAILLHELAHVRRGDYGWNLLLRLVQAFYWANPMVWLVGLSIARVREQACDEVCIHWLGGAENYRATLVELASALLRRPLAALGMAMARSSRLHRRLAQIDASGGRAECQSRRCWRIAALVFVTALAGALSALRVAGDAALADEPNVPDVETRERQKDDLTDPSKPKSAAPANQTAEPKFDQFKKSTAARPSKATNGDASGGMPEARPIKVRVEKVRREDFVVRTSQMGTLKASRSLELYAKVAGYVTARSVNVGDRVKKGQVLAEIDAPELEAELEQAKLSADEAPAAAEQAEGNLNEALAGLAGAKAEVAKSEAHAKQSASRLEFAKKTLVVHQDADRKVPGSTPQHELEKLAAEVESASGAAEGAKAGLDAAKAGVKQAEAAVAVAKAGLRIAQLQSDAAQQRLKRGVLLVESQKIVSPADGFVVSHSAEPGSFAKRDGEPLFVVSATNVVVMQANVPEHDALQVAPGQHARVWLDAERSSKPHDAKVSRGGYAIDPKTRTMSVEIDLDNADGRLRPGMAGGVSIDLETHPDALTMPMRFERADDDPTGKTCFRVVDGRAVKTRFAGLQWHQMAQRIELKSGLTEGDLVITQVVRGEGSANPMLKDGDSVEVIGNDDAEDSRAD